jgi:hypothetical protein
MSISIGRRALVQFADSAGWLTLVDRRLITRFLAEPVSISSSRQWWPNSLPVGGLALCGLMLLCVVAPIALVQYGPVSLGERDTLTPEAKQMIAEEVQRQIALENAENSAPDPSSSGIARMLSDNVSHIFVVSRSLTPGTGASGCLLSEGDVLQLEGSPPANAAAVDVVVLASKSQDCRKGVKVAVALTDLQDMQNAMRATIDQGLTELRSGQGQRKSSTETSSSVGPATVTLGQTTDQVIAALGTPESIIDLKVRKIFVYKQFKIIFTQGKLTGFQ